VAGLVLGVQSVPDGLASGLLAGVNPLAGLYAYMVGTITGAFFTSSVFMAVQATGAISTVVADVPAVHDASDPARALFTLSVLTGVVMLAAGLLRLGSVLRFVSNAVMVGFLGAVGVNIVLGQLANFTGYQAQGSNRVVRAVDTLLHPPQLHLQTLTIGATTIALILLLERTRLGALALVVAVFASVLAIRRRCSPSAHRSRATVGAQGATRGWRGTPRAPASCRVYKGLRIRRRRGSEAGPGRPGRRPARAPTPPGAGEACLAGAGPTPPAPLR